MPDTVTSDRLYTSSTPTLSVFYIILLISVNIKYLLTINIMSMPSLLSYLPVLSPPFPQGWILRIYPPLPRTVRWYQHCLICLCCRHPSLRRAQWSPAPAHVTSHVPRGGYSHQNTHSTPAEHRTISTPDSGSDFNNCRTRPVTLVRPCSIYVEYLLIDMLDMFYYPIFSHSGYTFQ